MTPKLIALQLLKKGDKFICGGKIYKTTNKSSEEVWAENQKTGNEEKFIHIDRQVELID